MTTQQARLLIVDDEAIHLKALCDTLEQEGYTTTGFTTGKAALQALREQEFDVLLTDLMMPETDGISLLQAALEIDSALVGIVMTGQGTISTAVNALKTGALDYVLKPLKLSAVLPVISRALNVRRLRMENIQLRETVGIYELSMATAFALDSGTIVRKVAETAFQQGDAGDVSVLLPTRDGKELYVAAALGQNADGMPGKRLPITNALSGWAVRTGKLFSDPGELSDLKSIPPFPLADITNNVAVPMLAAGKLMGILSFSPSRPNRAVPLGRIKTLNILAGAAASALHAAALVEDLRGAEQRYRLLADNAPDIVFRYELLPRLRCVYISPAVTALTGHSPEKFYDDPELYFKLADPEGRQLLEPVFRGESVESTITLRWTLPERRPIWIEQRHVFVQAKDGKKAAIEGIARDVTERVNLEEQLRHSQRMEAIGRLAGGVAHDFNNMLTIISGYSELAMNESPAGSASLSYIKEVITAVGSAAALTRQLLAFSRKQLLRPHVLSLNQVLENASKMLGRLVGEDIELITLLDPDLGAVKADGGQLEQIIMNLSVNARDAMPRGGKLTIETHNVTLDHSYSQGHFDVQPGPYVMLIVSDTGTGMDADTRSRIFEPFFTTKELGKGTGLGLSIVYGIIKQSGGNIWVYSEPGKGTTFKIYLPRVEEQIEQKEPAAAAKRTSGGSEVVLVVEDDDVLRNLTCTVLQYGGYKILEARNADDALEIQKRQGDAVGLVLTDLVMPGISGLELGEKLKEICPGTKILYTSGYSDDVIVRHGHLDPGMAFIGKPFGSAALLQKVRDVLDLE